MPLSARQAVVSDADLIGQLNYQLIRDEGHSNPMTVAELQERMRGWLAGDYKAVLFENGTGVVAYALYRDEMDLIYLRHLFVQRHCRRQGIGREAVAILREKFWPAGKRLTVEVLAANTAAVTFYRRLGFRAYGLTLEIPPA
jgi:GNAT superfamily N-acetyltransferase